MTAVFRFNAGAQNYDSFRSGVPMAVNSLRTLNPGDALLVLSSSAGVGESPNTAPSDSAGLVSGANFVTYLGTGAPIEQALGGISGLLSVFVFEADTQTWSIWRPRARPYSTR